MEEEISRMKTFLNEQIQSPTSEEISLTRIGNYGLNTEDVIGQVTDWVLNYLDNDNRKCPYSLAVSIAKEVAHQVSASFLQGEVENIGKTASSANLYAEAIGKISDVCNAFSNQGNLEPICSAKYATSVFAIKNKRRKMEDKHVIHHDLNAVLDIKDAPYQSYYAVFDGHSGIDAACYASAQLHVNIAKHPDFFTDTPKAITDGYQITDLNFLNKCNEWNIKSGCTAVSALIRDNKIFLSWLGDSQAVLVKGGVPVKVTSPHKPDREDERQRIEGLGGHITHMGTWRVNGLLAVTRAIGDPDQKPYISSEPEIDIVSLDGTEDFLIIACDGLWDGITPEDATGILYRYLAESPRDEPLDAVAAKLVHQSKLQGSEDNITAIVVFLRDIKDIKETAAQFLSNPLHCVQNHDFFTMNGNMKMFNVDQNSDAPFPKPTVLELNAASSKKLKNAANVMSSAGFGGASYSYQYVENSAEVPFQTVNPSSSNSAESAYMSQAAHTASCFAPEATALSELPTPPIDDMLASQEFENFYSTDLYKELNNSQPSQDSQSVDSNDNVHKNSGSNEPLLLNVDISSEFACDIVTSSGSMSLLDTKDNSQSVDTNVVEKNLGSNEPLLPNVDVPSQFAGNIVTSGDNMSLLDIENSTSANPGSILMPDEALGIASTVVTDTIETAVKCLSDEIQEPVPAQSPKKLNPYAKPFVMKSFFSSDESDSMSSSFVAGGVEDSLLPSKESNSKLDNQILTTSAEFSLESNIHQSDTDDLSAEQPIQSNQSASLGSFDKLSTELDSNSSITVNKSAEQIGKTIPEGVPANCSQQNIESSHLLDVLEKSNLSQNSFTENVDNKSDISIMREQFEHLRIESIKSVSELSEQSKPDSAMNILLVSNETKNANLSSVPGKDLACQDPLKQESVTEFITYSVTNFKESISEQNQNLKINPSEVLYESNTAIIPELESKHEIVEKYVEESSNWESSQVVQNVEKQSALLMNVQVEQSQAETTENEFITEPTKVSPEESTMPAPNQNTDLAHVHKGLMSEVIEAEIKSKCEEIQKSIVDTGKKSENAETSSLVEPMSLIDIKDELIPTEAEVPSALEPVAVDLKSLPEGIPEAEGVTEDIDSDSEKDGGWSYMKVNAVSGSKSKPDEKPSKTVKSNTTAKAKRDLSKPSLDIKSKVKSVTMDKTKSSVVDKSKGVSADKSKNVAADKSKSATSADKTKTLTSVDKAKTLASDKNKVGVEKKPDVRSRVLKSSTLSATTTKVNSDKTSRITTVSSMKKETDVTKTTSSVAKSSRPTTVLRSTASANKPASTTVDRSPASSRVNTKPKPTSTLLESKPSVKNIASSTLIKASTSAQSKSSIISSRTTLTRPATSVSMKTSTVSKPMPQKSAVNVSKPRPPSAALTTMKKPITATAKKPDVKEVKDNANKQILAKKTSTTSRVESSSTLANRRVVSANNKSTSSKLSSASKLEAKKDVPKAPIMKSMTKNAGSKVSQEDTKSKGKIEESAQCKKDETKNNLNIASDQKNVAEIEQISDEKFILETSDKEKAKEIGEISNAEQVIVENGSLTNPITPGEVKMPIEECTSENL